MCCIVFLILPMRQFYVNDFIACFLTKNKTILCHSFSGRTLRGERQTRVTYVRCCCYQCRQLLIFEYFIDSLSCVVSRFCITYSKSCRQTVCVNITSLLRVLNFGLLHESNFDLSRLITIRYQLRHLSPALPHTQTGRH